MSAVRRRFFWGHSLSQALARAARYFGLAPERLAYRVREKRHGYVRHPRAVLIEIDPLAPESASSSTRAPVAPPTPTARPRPARPTDRPARRVDEREEERWDSPDAESELAAAEAIRRLVAFAGLELVAEIQPAGDRLQIALSGVDEERLREGGAVLLDAFEALLPRVIVALCDRRVRCRVDGAGIRSVREEELRALARDAAARARVEGEAVLEPLPPAERRIVHLELQDLAGLSTESLGHGFTKRVRVVAQPSAAGD